MEVKKISDLTQATGGLAEGDKILIEGADGSPKYLYYTVKTIPITGTTVTIDSDTAALILNPNVDCYLSMNSGARESRAVYHSQTDSTNGTLGWIDFSLLASGNSTDPFLYTATISPSAVTFDATAPVVNTTSLIVRGWV